MSLRQGPQIGAVSYDEAKAAGFDLPADRRKAAPAAVAVTTIDDVEPLGTFSGRTAAESRALAIAKKQKGYATLFAMQVKGVWCVCKTEGGKTVYVEG